MKAKRAFFPPIRLFLRFFLRRKRKFSHPALTLRTYNFEVTFKKTFFWNPRKNSGTLEKIQELWKKFQGLKKNIVTLEKYPGTLEKNAETLEKIQEIQKKFRNSRKNPGTLKKFSDPRKNPKFLKKIQGL